MSGLAATREDEREEAGPPPTGAEGGERGGDVRKTWGMPVGCGAPSPTPSAPREPLAAEADSQPLSGYSRGAGVRPSPSSVPGEHSLHGCSGGHATLPTINGSLCNKQEESCFANAAELSLHNTAAKHLSAGLNKDGSVLGADGSR